MSNYYTRVVETIKTQRSLAVLEPSKETTAADMQLCLSKIMSEFQDHLSERSDRYVGYPHNLNFNHYTALHPLLRFLMNNIGDPFSESNIGLNSRIFEVGALDWFARLWEIEGDEYWGYVTSCGTEGNLQAILLGREVLPNGILYASRESHYSIFKAAKMFRIDCKVINTLITGEIDCVDLKKKLSLNKDKPAIINANIGTTFKGAIDNIDHIIKTLQECGFSENRYYIHCDAALNGLISPFLEEGPRLSFKNPIGSISVSAHKLLGSPMPSGVYITRKKYVALLSTNIEYVGIVDNTISGSRSGHAPIFIWYSLSMKGRMGIQRDVKTCLRNAQYLRNRLRKADVSTLLNENSVVVVFEKPFEQDFIRHWQLSCVHNLAHIVVMPHVTTKMLDDFIDNLFDRRRVWYGNGKVVPPCVAEEIGPLNCACLIHGKAQNGHM